MRICKFSSSFPFHSFNKYKRQAGWVGSKGKVAVVLFIPQKSCELEMEKNINKSTKLAQSFPPLIFISKSQSELNHHQNVWGSTSSATWKRDGFQVDLQLFPSSDHLIVVNALTGEEAGERRKKCWWKRHCIKRGKLTVTGRFRHEVSQYCCCSRSNA